MFCFFFDKEDNYVIQDIIISNKETGQQKRQATPKTLRIIPHHAHIVA